MFLRTLFKNPWLPCLLTLLWIIIVISLRGFNWISVGKQKQTAMWHLYVIHYMYPITLFVHLPQQCHNTTVSQHNSVTTQQCHDSKSVIFQDKNLKVSKRYNFLLVQRRTNCSPAASFANWFMTLNLLKVHQQTFISVPITQKYQKLWQYCRNYAIYINKVVQIWLGLFTLVYTQISPGHIWTTL